MPVYQHVDRAAQMVGIITDMVFLQDVVGFGGGLSGYLANIVANLIIVCKINRRVFYNTLRISVCESILYR